MGFAIRAAITALALAQPNTIDGLGSSRPIADNDTDLGRAMNRRIEVARTDCTR